MQMVGMQTFNFNQELDAYRERLMKRMAAYVLAHEKIRLPDIARKFGINESTLQIAMVRCGVQRIRGRKSYHYPKAQ